MASDRGSSIPIVDLSAFTSGGDQESRKAAAEELAVKGRINGCVGITGHGVPAGLLEEALIMTKKLSDLAYEEKTKAPPLGALPMKKGATKDVPEIDDEGQGDVNLEASNDTEDYEIASNENSAQYNVWLPQDVLPGFRQFTIGSFWALNKTARAILEALIMGLDLTDKEAESVRASHIGHQNQLRLLHYPFVSAHLLKNRGVDRLDAHTDRSPFTLLAQEDDHGSGLEIGDCKTSELLPATPKEGVVYMNIGDMFARISNGMSTAALYRVVISGKATGEEVPARYSISYFVVPLPDGVIELQSALVTTNGK